MALQPGLVFSVAASAYRNGALERGMEIFGDALDRAMRATGFEMGDLVNRMDEAGERTVMRIDSLLARSGPLLRIAASDLLMSLVGRLLELAVVRRAAVAAISAVLVRVVSTSEEKGTPCLRATVD